MSNRQEKLKGIAPHFYVFAAIACWDALTTIIGTVKALGGVSIGSMMLGLMTSVMVVILIFMTFEVWSDTIRVFRGNKTVQRLMQGMWAIAVVYDVYTCMVGNAALMSVDFGSASGVVVLFLGTILLVGSSFVAAYIYDAHTRSIPQKEDL